MMSNQLKFYLSDEARKQGVQFRLPREGDAGFDLPCLYETTIPAGELSLVRTGVHLSIPFGWVGLIRDRSGVALRAVATVAGVIDSSYRGEVKIAMHNLGREPITFVVGERIAQCVVIPHLSGSLGLEVETEAELGQTERGSAGFGSTGV